MSNKSSKASIWLSIFGVLAGVLGASLSLTVRWLPKELVIAQLIAIAVLVVLVFAMMVISMLRSKQIIVKLAALPVMFAMVTSGLMVYYSGFHRFILAAGGHIEYDSSIVNTDIIFDILMPMMQIGVWVTVIPVFIAAMIMILRTNKGQPKSKDKYIPGYGRIVNVEATDIRINRRPVYRFTVEIRTHLSDVYTATRDMHLTYEHSDLLIPNQEIRFFVHERKKTDFYFDINGEMV